MNKQKLTITLSKESYQILEKYSKLEYRSLSNMIEITLRAYDEIHHTKY